MLDQLINRARRINLNHGGLGKIDHGLLVILALPLLLLSVNSNWIFTGTGLIDPWVYFGYFFNFTQHLQTFAGKYFGTRLSWILPGYLAYKLFPPLIANYVLHLTFYYIAVISLYLILKHTINRRAALLSSILMGCYSYFLWAIGWDYIDGAGIAYLLLTMLLLTCAAKFSRWQLSLCLSGLSFAALIYSNIFWIAFAPLPLTYYLFANDKYRKNPLYPSLIFFIIGLAGLTLLFGVINYAITTKFWFFWPSFRYALEHINEPNPWRASSYAWPAQAPWLVLPALTFLGSFISLFLSRVNQSFNRNPLARFFHLHYILMLLIIVTWELMGTPILQFPYYASYLIPGMFLATGSQFALVLTRLKAHQFFLLVCSTIFTLVVPFVPAFGSLFTPYRRPDILLPLAMSLLGLFFLKRAINTKSLALFFLCLSIANFAMLNEAIFDFRGGRDKKQKFLAVAKSMQTIQTFAPEGNFRLWFDENTPLGFVYHAVGYTYFRELINAKFPLLDGGTQISPNAKIAILSNEKDAFEKADESLSQIGLLNVRLLSEKNMEEGNISFTITFIDVEVDRDQLAPEPTFVANFYNWEETDYVADVFPEETTRSVKIVTKPPHADYGYEWLLVSRPIVVNPHSTYLVEFDLKIEAGGAGVGILGADKTILAPPHYRWQPRADFVSEQFLFDTTDDSEIFIVISNCGYPEPTVSAFWLKDLEIWEAR